MMWISAAFILVLSALSSPTETSWTSCCRAAAATWTHYASVGRNRASLSHLQGFRRGLASLPAPAADNEGSVTEAATAADLRRALQIGARHIVITAHMDLTSVPAADAIVGDFLLASQDGSTRSVRGNCTAALQMRLEDPPPLPLLPGQCVIVTVVDLWLVQRGRLWMHNLYLRHMADARDGGVALIESTGPSAQLWMTQMTMQGAGTYVRTGASASTLGLKAAGPTYAESCQFSHLGGNLSVVYTNATLRVVNCTFANNNGSGEASPVLYASPTGAAWIQNSAFVDNSVKHVLAADFGSPGFASDEPRRYFEFGGDATGIDASPQPEDESMFLSGEDEWLQGVKAELGLQQLQIDQLAPIQRATLPEQVPGQVGAAVAPVQPATSPEAQPGSNDGPAAGALVDPVGALEDPVAGTLEDPEQEEEASSNSDRDWIVDIFVPIFVAIIGASAILGGAVIAIKCKKEKKEKKKEEEEEQGEESTASGSGHNTPTSEGKDAEIRTATP